MKPTIPKVGCPIFATASSSLRWAFVRSTNRFLCTPQYSVILSEAPRSFIASGEVEGSAVALDGACSCHNASVVVCSCRHSERSEESRRSPRHRNRPNLFATTLFLTLVFVAARTQAQLPAGTIDTTATQSNPNSALLTQANEALQKRDFAAAEKLLTTLTHDNPKDPHLLFDLGLTEENLNHEEAAEAAYRAASAADAKFAPSHLALGLLLARNGKPADARTELLAAANIPPDPSDPEAPAVTARALRALARIDLATNAADARDELLFALKLSAETPDDIQLSGQIAEGLSDLPLAESAYRRLLTLEPGDPAATAALAHVLVQQKKAADAEALLTTALAAHPGDTALTAQLATTYLAEDDPTKSGLAVPLVEALHRQHPAETSVTRLLARLYAQTNQPEKADPLYSALVQQEPKDPTLLDDYGANLLHLRRYAEAEVVLKRAVADPAAFPTPDDLAAAYSHLAFSASENNDPTMTLQALDLRAKVSPNTAGSVFLEATAHDKLHQYKQAFDLYKQFLAMIQVAANGKFADQEWEARHRLLALEHMK
jgi:Tfp pilus assembly protein PilF